MDYFSLDIGGTDIKWAVISQDYEILRRGRVPTPQDSAAALIDTLAPLAGHAQYAGIGVSVPGSILDGREGVVQRGGHLKYLDGVPLGRLLEDRCAVPVFVENDGKCCALGEYAFGALKGARIGVVLVIGTGIGGGIVIDGKVLKGAHAFAGEFSFIITDSEKSGPIFGKTGGWRSGLMRRVAAAKGLPGGAELSGLELFALINAGDPQALGALEDYAGVLAMHIYNLQAILDPVVFAIGGGIGGEPALIEAIRRGLDRLVGENPLKFPVPNVIPAATGKDANLLGAVYALRSSI